MVLPAEAAVPGPVDALSEMASPVPSSVCPTESSAVSTAVGETVELYITDGESSCEDNYKADDSDVESSVPESGSDGDTANHETIAAWEKVGSRLAHAFEIAAENESSDDEEFTERLTARWLKEPLRVRGEAEGLSPPRGQASFSGVLGSRNTRPEDLERNSGLALLESYGVCQAPTGTWRRAPSSSQTASFESNEEDSVRGDDEVDGPEEWQNVGQMFVRALRDSSDE